MEQYFDALRNCPLFRGITDAELSAMLPCLGGRITRFDKGNFIMTEGEAARDVGVVLSGSAHIIREDYFGNKSIIERIGPSDLFGESFACAGIPSIPISVIAAEPSQVMLVDCLKITCSCSNACEFHHRMIYNLLKVVAEKNIAFHQKIEITSRRSTREKLLAYLLLQAKNAGADSFEIPYNRQELADYLGVERSGLSVEIGKLCRQGVITADRKQFQFLKNWSVPNIDCANCGEF